MRFYNIFLISLVVVVATLDFSPTCALSLNLPLTTNIHHDKVIRIERNNPSFHKNKNNNNLCFSSIVRLHPKSVFFALPDGTTAADLSSQPQDPDDPITNIDDDNTTTDQRNKSNLIQSYQIMTYLYGFIGLLFWFIPDRTSTVRLASKWGGAAGFGLAAGVSHILGEAALHDRLKSDTYKRLNVGMLAFSLLGLVAIPGEAAFATHSNTAMIVAGMALVVRLIGLATAYSGWKRGVVVAVSPKSSTTTTALATNKFGPNQMLQEIMVGTKTTWLGLRVQNRKKALTYRNSLIIVGVAMLSSFMEGIFGLRYRFDLKKSFFLISLQWSAVARLALISTMIYSLKDAAERDRLSGTTFIQLNWLLAAWAFLVWMGQCIVATGFVVTRAEFLALSLFFLTKGIKSLKEQSATKKK